MLHKIKLTGQHILEVTYWHNHINGTRPLILLHGHGGDHRGLTKLARQIPVTTFVLDLPGFGDSDELEVHSVDAYVAAIEQFATQNKLEAYDVLGHSLGSAFALAVAAHDARVDRLVLVNPIPEFATIIRRFIKALSLTASSLPPKWGEALVHARLYNVVTFLLHSRQRHNFSHANNYLRAQNTAQYSLKTWQESGDSIYQMDQQAFAVRVLAATLILHGDKDRMTSTKAVDSFASLFKHARLIKLPKAGHFIPLEDVDIAAQHIGAFLA